jgi:hypothetical protein
MIAPSVGHLSPSKGSKFSLYLIYLTDYREPLFGIVAKEDYWYGGLSD